MGRPAGLHCTIAMCAWVVPVRYNHHQGPHRPVAWGAGGVLILDNKEPGRTMHSHSLICLSVRSVLCPVIKDQSLVKLTAGAPACQS